MEIDLHASWLSRQPVFAAMGVPEVWQFDGERLAFFHLEGNGAYHPVTYSEFLPLAAVDVQQVIDRVKREGGSVSLQTLQKWVREQVRPT